MKMQKVCLTAVLCVFATVAVAQQALNNDGVIKLTKAGLSDDLIVSTIKAKPGAYDTAPDGLIALKAAGVSDKVVAAMVAKDAAAAPESSAQAATAPDPAPAASAPPTQVPESAAQAAEAKTPATVPDSKSKRYSSQIPPGARVVIAPMGGFETYFAAAIREKGVPITLTLNRDSAQYFVVSTETEWRGFVAGSSAGADWNPSGGHYGSSSSASSTRGLESSIMLIDSRSKDVVWAYEVHKSSHGALLFGTLAARGQQSLAEACAKHLKEFIEKGR